MNTINNINSNQIIDAFQVVVGITIIWAGINSIVRLIGKKLDFSDDTIFKISGLVSGCLLGIIYEYKFGELVGLRQHKIETIESSTPNLDVWRKQIDRLWFDQFKEWKQSGVLSELEPVSKLTLDPKFDDAPFVF